MMLPMFLFLFFCESPHTYSWIIFVCDNLDSTLPEHIIAHKELKVLRSSDWKQHVAQLSLSTGGFNFGEGGASLIRGQTGSKCQNPCFFFFFPLLLGQFLHLRDPWSPSEGEPQWHVMLYPSVLKPNAKQHRRTWSLNTQLVNFHLNPLVSVQWALLLSILLWIQI